MTENEIAKVVVDATYTIHREIGPGLLESAYEAMMAFELRDRGLSIERQVEIPVCYRGVRVDEAFRADLIVNQKLIVELKSVERVAPVHKKQLLTYSRLTDMKLGLLINFGQALLKDGVSRVVNGLED